jgi:hypothetical protein
MILSRRTVLQSGATIAAMSTSAGAAITAKRPALIVFDSRLQASRLFADQHGAPRIDVALEDASFWRTLRSAKLKGEIVGLTGWSDWVLVRGMLEENGKRLKAEAQAGGLFHWAMA